jgi:hypothetical protein
VDNTQVANQQTPVHQHWLSRGRLLAADAGFAAYATALAADTGHADRTWAIWAAAGYWAAALIILVTRHRNVPVLVPLLVSLAGAMAAPVAWLATRVAPTAEVQVISRSAVLLLQHGTPYLAPGQFDSWLSYNPYLPVMAVFGLPRALGASGLPGDPRVWLAVTSTALIWAAFRVAAPHRGCEDCRHGVLLSTIFAVASPAIAFPLAVGITDPPVIGLLFLALALITRPSGVLRAAAALGVACAMKATAWPAVPVFGAMLAARDAARSAWRFIGATAAVAVVLSLVMAPAALADPVSFVANTVLYPLGLTKHETPAASPLPGHLLAMTGPAGHWAAIGLLVTAGVAFAVWIIVRPPAGARAAAWRLALGFTAMFTLAPATRWGYYVYPICLGGWLVVTGQTATRAAAAVPRAAPAERGVLAGAQRGAGYEPWRHDSR